MSIVIVALPRTGSTVLCRALGRALKYEYSQEPFNTRTLNNRRIDFSDINEDTPVVVKTMIEQFPRSEKFQEKFPDIFNSELSSAEIAYKWNKFFIQRFKHVILLDRKDIYDQCISITNAQSSTREYSKNHWHTNYRPFIDDKKIQECISIFSRYKTNLEVLSHESNIPITYYEDLYSNYLEKRMKAIKHVIDSQPNFDSKLYLNYTDPKLKYRITKEPNTLI